MNKKLTTELFLVLLLSAVVSVSCMLFLYENRFAFYAWTKNRGFLSDDREEYKEWILEQAPEHDLKPDLREEKERESYDQEYLPFLFQKRDRYTGVFINQEGSEKCITAYLPEVINQFSGWLWSDADIFSQAHMPVKFKVQFRDCTAVVTLNSYQIMQVIPLYLTAGILLCVAIFLIPVLVFVQRRMAYLGRLREEILVMAEGDLEHSLTVKGRNEITELAVELNSLRQTLKENMEKERQSHQANEELVRAMSHDLRTPLTTLGGYLEILNRGKGNPEKYPQYLQCCLKKTEEIRAMTDKMFEYTLVFEGQDQVEKQELPCSFLEQELVEQIQYLKESGFCVNTKTEGITGKLSGNSFLIKRLFWNLFSNVWRYGRKELAVDLNVFQKGNGIEICLKNGIGGEQAAAGSGVGLQSAKKIVQLHGGRIFWKEEQGFFGVTVWLPLS